MSIKHKHKQNIARFFRESFMMMSNTSTISILDQRLAYLSQAENRPLLQQGLRGIERETLRAQADGKLALTPHPQALGSTLTHPFITTDYSESLLEFITPAVPNAETAIHELKRIHQFTYAKLENEILWNHSMPCALPKEEDIPIAWYGHSHIGMLKHIYRRGLAVRYGKNMQCIAGIHYNFSLSESVWELLRTKEQSHLSPKAFQSESYIALIRNFNRYSWLLMYLFGASPAVNRCFLSSRHHQLDSLNEDTYYLPYATSLRMSDLGYQNNAQDGLMPPYNSLSEYMRNLALAIRQPYAPYEKIGLKQNGEWVQINTHILQIENEFYATIRPKRTIKTGERPLEALCSRGIQYVEVRCLDTDPFSPIGIQLETCHFLDVFLHYCALSESPLTNEEECHRNVQNFKRVVMEGRRPHLALDTSKGKVGLQEWGKQLIEAMRPIAALLDETDGGESYQSSLNQQLAKIEHSELTPSALVLQKMRESTSHPDSFHHFTLELSQQYADMARSQKLAPLERAYFESLAEHSLQDQKEIEANQHGSLDAYIEDYRSRNSSNLCCDDVLIMAN